MSHLSAVSIRRVSLLMTLAACTAGLSACESPFVDAADRQAYPLVAQRQEQALGSASDLALARPMVPLAITERAYEKVPQTDNRIPEPGQIGQTSAATQPSEQAAATQPAASQPDPLAALLERTPTLDFQNQGELPPFPRPVPAGKNRLVFNLNDAFNYALEHSREYQSRKEDLYITALQVALARHQFEPRLFATTTANVNGAGESSDFRSAVSAAQTVGVRQRLPYGGEIVASGLVAAINEVRRELGDGQSAEVALQANIPLLRGAGMVAQEPLIQAERNLVYEVRDFERFRRAYLVTVASTYFALVNQRAQVLNRFRSVQSYIFITQRTAALFEAGVGRRRVSQLDLQRAQQSEFQARNDLTNAIQQYESSVDAFKIVLGMPADQPLDVRAQYLDISPPEITEANAVEIALKLRLDLQTRRDQVEDAQRQNKVAGNALLPNLDVTARSGLSTDPLIKSFAVQGRSFEYSAGMSLDLPLDRVAERNAYRVSLINIDRARRTVELNEDQIGNDVRDSLRRVRQQQYLVSLQRANIDLASRRKEFADIQFKNGEIDNRDYLDAETALLDAQNRFAQAVSALQIATLQFLRDTDQLRVNASGHLLIPSNAAGVTTPVQTMPAAPALEPGQPLPAMVPSTQPSAVPE